MQSGRSIGLIALLTATLTLGCGKDDAGPVDAGPPPEDQCLGAMDQEVLAVLMPDGGVVDAGVEFDAVSEVFADCSRNSCLEESFGGDAAVIATCMDTCIDGTSMAGLSSGCRACYYEQITCALSNCLTVCAAASSDACLSCLNADCAPRLYACRGF